MFRGWLGRMFGWARGAAESPRATLAPELECRFNNALAQLADGKVEPAAAELKEIMALQPGFLRGHYELGNAQMSFDTDGAIASYRSALGLDPAFVPAFVQLGNTYMLRREWGVARLQFEAALSLEPTSFPATCGMGFCLLNQWNIREAKEYFEKAMALSPGRPEAYLGMGQLFRTVNTPGEAESWLRKGLDLNPGHATGNMELGIALREQGRMKEAMECLHKVAELDPKNFFAYNNMANILKDANQLEEAAEYYKKAMLLSPEEPWVGSNYLLCLNYSTSFGREELFKAHVDWAQRHAAPLVAKAGGYQVSPDPERRLRVGYVSGDFKHHVLMRFLEPVLLAHDYSRFEIFCYSASNFRDEITVRVAQYADEFRYITEIRDEDAAEIVRQDRIDILIDMSGHTGMNRLLMFARKPAPVQATFLGYPATTGLSTMDYRITDIYADPPGLTERYYVETLVRLPDCLWCYREPVDAPPVNPLPALESGRITFGSFNYVAKLNPAVIALWSKILNAVPDSKLMLLPIPVGMPQERLYAMFEANGIPRERLEMHAKLATFEFQRMHNRVDVAFDPFPINGGATTCETLWMGVPVITLAGDTFLSRAGVTLLTNAGLPELVASSPEEYVEIAKRLAGDVKYLAGLRAGLRQRLKSSPLMDAERYTRNLEQIYRNMWIKWCQAHLEQQRTSADA